MKIENRRNDSLRPRRISRRDFISLAAAAGLLAGCSPTQQLDVTPTSEPNATSTSAPDATPSVAVRRPEIVKFYPDVSSRVVHTHHTGAWDGDVLVPDALRQMLDASITELTGLKDARDAWAALFAPDERIAVKVNALRGPCPTHVPLVVAVTGCLRTAGVPAEQIVIFDRYADELRSAGYTINKDGPGVRCYGTDDFGVPERSSSTANNHYVVDWRVVNIDVGLSEILMSCDALINMPILKAAMLPEVGMTFAMKNHFGTLDRPADLHGEKFRRAVAELNALPPIKDRTRLIIGDALTLETRRGNQAVGVGNTILASFDPVAHDAIGLQIAAEAFASEELDSAALTTPAILWLESATALGLGTNDPNHMDLVEVNLG